VVVPLGQSETIELELLLEAIHRRYGFDFRDYTAAPLRRRLLRRALTEGAESLSELQGLLLRDPALPIIVMSAYPEALHRIHAQHVFEKPFPTGRLLDTLERVHAEKRR